MIVGARPVEVNTVPDALDRYGSPIPGEDPCGEALDYDLDFLELEIAARGQPAAVGEAAAEQPAWAEVARLASVLSERSKDLRVAVLDARAALHLGGLAGLAGKLEIIATYVDQFWIGLHPRPDPEDQDGEDQTVRLNSLANLCDREGIVVDLRQLPITESRLFGAFSVRDLVDAQKRAAEGDQSAPDLGTIEHAFLDTEATLTEDYLSSLEAITLALTKIEARVRDQVGAADAVALSPLIDVARQLQTTIEEHRRPPDAGANSGAATKAEFTTSGDLRDRNDVIAALDRICRWYRAHEPSSPIPAILDRARRLVAKDFLGLLTELAPDGAAHFRMIAGISADGETAGV